MEWRLVITDPVTGVQRSLTPDDAIDALTSFSVDRNGSCAEATFTALPSVNILPRDIVTLNTLHAGALVPRWHGMITQTASARANAVQTYRAVGLKQRLYEIPLTVARVSAGDVGEMALAALSGITMPAGIGPHLSGNVPLTGFQLGDRYPALESVGAFLDALAATVGPFIVPAGEQYVYDGHAYSAGDAVPGVMWGVDAYRRLNFQRPRATVIPLSERARRVRVTWDAVDAEDVVTSPALVYATEMVSAGWSVAFRYPGGVQADRVEYRAPPPMRPLYAIPLGSTAADAHEVRAVPWPLDHMTTTPLTLQESSGWVNLANATDGNMSTYATANTGLLPYITMYTGSLGRPAAGILRLRYRSAIPTPDGNWTFPTLTMYGRTNANAWRTAVYYTLPESEVFTEVYYPFLFPADMSDADVAATTRFRFILTIPRGSVVTDDPRLYDVSFFVVDDAAAEAVARTFVRTIPAEVATVTYDGVSDPAHAVNVTTAAGSVLAGLPVERTEYAITRDAGVTTTYHIGRAFPAELEVQRVVLERLARRATGSTP